MSTAMHHPVVLSAEQITRSEPQKRAHTLFQKRAGLWTVGAVVYGSASRTGSGGVLGV